MPDDPRLSVEVTGQEGDQTTANISIGEPQGTSALAPLSASAASDTAPVSASPDSATKKKATPSDILAGIALAREDGYTDDQIAAHLATKRADFAAAFKDGYKLGDVETFLSKKAKEADDTAQRMGGITDATITDLNKQQKEFDRRADAGTLPVAQPLRDAQGKPMSNLAALLEFANLVREKSALSKPSLDLPKPQTKGIVSGLARGGAELIEGATTPENLLLGASIAGAPAVLKKVGSAAFFAMMGKGAYEQGKAAIESKTPGESAEHAIQAVGMALGMGLLGAHEISSLKSSPAYEAEVKEHLKTVPDEALEAALADPKLLEGVPYNPEFIPLELLRREGERAKAVGATQTAQAVKETVFLRGKEITAEGAPPPTAAPTESAPSETPQIPDIEKPSPAKSGGRSKLFQQAMEEEKKPEAASGATDEFYAAESHRQAAGREATAAKETPPEIESRIRAAYNEAVKASTTDSVPITDVLEKAGFSGDKMAEGKQHLVDLWRQGKLTAFSFGDFSLSNARQQAGGLRTRAGEDSPYLRMKMAQSPPAEVEPPATPKKAEGKAPAEAAAKPTEAAAVNPRFQKVVDAEISGLHEASDEAEAMEHMEGIEDEAVRAAIAKQYGIGTEGKTANDLNMEIAEKAMEVKEATPKVETPAAEAEPDEERSTLPKRSLGEGGSMTRRVTGADYEGGPGAMGPVEAAEMKAGLTRTSTKNAIVDEERVARGLPPMMTAARQNLGEVWESAMRVIDANENAGRELVSELNKKPRAITAVEEATLLHHKIDVMNDLDRATNRILDEGATPQEKLAAQVDSARLMDELNEIDGATKKAGTEWGRTGRFRQQLAAEDYTLSNMLRKATAAKGAPLTPGQTEQIAKLNARIAELEKQLAEHEEASDVRADTVKDAEADKAIDRIRKKKQPPSSDQQKAKILEGIKRNSGKLENIGSWIQKLAEHFVRNGIVERDALVAAVHGAVKDILPDATPRQIRDAISGYGDYKELSKDQVKVKLRDLKGQMQQISKLDDMLKEGKLPAKTGMERRIPSAEERALAKEVNRVKKELGLEATDPNQLKSALDAVKTRLRNRIEDLQRALNKKEKLPVKGRSLVDDAEAKELRNEKEALESEYKTMVGVDTPAMEAAKELALERSIAELNQQIASGDVETKSGAPTADTARVAELKLQRDALIKQKQEIRKSKNPSKTEDERKVELLEKRADDLRARIAKGDIAARTGRPTVDTKEVAAAKDELAKLNAQMSEMRKAANPPKTPEEIKERALDKRIAELEAKIAAGDLSTKTGTPTVPTKEIAEKQDRLADLNKQLADLRKAARPKLTPDQIALKIYKTRTLKRIDDLNSRVARGDFSKTPRRVITLDKEGLALKAKADAAKLEFDRALFKDRLEKRTLVEKALDTFPRVSRAFLLSNPVTLAKLTAAAGWRLAITPVEEGVGEGISRLPLISQIAERAPREGGGFNVRAETKALTEGFTEGMKDAYDVLTKRETKLDVIGGKRRIIPHEWLDFIGNIHGALKSPVKRAEFARSFQKRAEFYANQGVDVTDDAVILRVSMEAYRDANRAIFQQDNKLVTMWNTALKQAESPSKVTGRPLLAGKIGVAAAKTILPIVKIPTNIVAEAAEYAFGSVTGSARMGLAFRRGIETLKPEEADLIMRQLKKGSLGAATITLGFLAPQVIGGYYQFGKKRDPKDVKAGGARLYGVEIPSTLLHNPAIEQLQIGSTIRRVADGKLRKKDQDAQGIPAGIAAAALGLTSEVPFIREQIELGKMFNPYQRTQFFGELARSRLEPQLVQYIAQEMDKDEKGEPIKRDPKTIAQYLESGIPGYRRNVPEKKEKRSNPFKARRKSLYSK